MRYLGNKETILSEITAVLQSNNLLNQRYTFFDAFCGTGSVSNLLKSKFDIIVNDNLNFAKVYSLGRLYKGTLKFDNLGFNPIEYFNFSNNTLIGFISLNYCPAYSSRMYFSDFNGGRIDYFRTQIENWYSENKITNEEYYFLLASLIESVSKVANIAGVYGSFLKKWDPRAIKPIKFIEVEGSNEKHNSIIGYNCNIRDIIDTVDCDILYLDPPYTKNKYTSQYHLLETLVCYDNPTLYGKTGTRHFDNVSSAWSQPYNVNIELDYIMSHTKAKHVLLSYSSDGLMTKEFIISCFKRYCKNESIVIKEIPYKKYRNFKTKMTEEHFEYIFYGEKKNVEDVEYCCPLNYMGGKSQTFSYLKPFLDSNKSCFIDLMAGGFNVGINVLNYKKYIYNDLNFIVKDLVSMFNNIDLPKFLKFIDKTIESNNLSKANKETYITFRNKYNEIYKNHNNWNWYLYVLILFGFQQQIRFNSNYEFNNPVGESGYSESIKEKIVSFTRRLNEMNIDYYSCDYETIEPLITADTFVYIDPPYLITLGSYNDGKRGFKGWNKDEEIRLLDFLTRIKNKGCNIVLSNVLNYKDKINDLLIGWIKDNNLKVNFYEFRKRKEAVIII